MAFLEPYSGLGDQSLITWSYEKTITDLKWIWVERYSFIAEMDEDSGQTATNQEVLAFPPEVLPTLFLFPFLFQRTRQ